jgi:hypothetical protein
MRKQESINLEKYYTPIETAKYCINKAFEIIGKENISDIIEPSAGNGSFSLQLEGCKAYDIEPEHESIIQQNFLELDLKHKEGRLIIGNPPFGFKNNLALQFYKKSIKLGDYISFILPISQLNNNISMYEFDLIYSEDLGELEYFNANKLVKCVLNIYKRNINGLNKRPNYKLRDVNIIEYRRSRQEHIPTNYDFAICGFGSIGKICEYDNQYCKIFYILINNDSLRNKIKETILNADWKGIYKMTNSPNLLHWQIYKYLKEQIAEIQ